MFVGRDKLVDLLKRNAELTLDQALEELNIPLGAMDAVLNPEDFFIIGHRLCHGGAAVAAGGAGVRSQAGLANVAPAADQLGLVVLQQVMLIGEGVYAVSARQGATITGGGAVGFVRDTRWGPLARSVHGFIGQQNTIPVTGTLLGTIARMLANTSIVVPFDMVLVNGANVAFDSGADNQAIQIYLWWRELDIRAR